MDTIEELQTVLQCYQRCQQYLISIKNEFDKKDVTLKIPRFFELDFQKRIENLCLIEKINNDTFVHIVNTSEVVSIFEKLFIGIKEIDGKLSDNLREYQNARYRGYPLKFYLSGPVGVGKTLGTMACAARLKTIDNVRVLYIHDVSKLIKPNNQPDETFKKELFAAFCLDKDSGLRDQLANSPPKNLTKLVREYIFTNRIVFVSVWDNVNTCYDNNNGSFIYKSTFPYPPAHYHVDGLTECCNEIVLCLASFNNTPTKTPFSNPKLWTQLIMKSVDQTECVSLINSLNPFRDLFQQLPKSDQEALLVEIEYLTSDIPLEIRRINDCIINCIKLSNSQKSPEVIRQSLQNYKIDALKSICSDHWNNFKSTLIQDETKKQKFYEYILCMNARVPLLKGDVLEECLDKKLMRLVDTKVRGLEGDYCMIEPIHHIAQEMFDAVYPHMNDMKYIEDNILSFHRELKSTSVLGTSIEFVLSKYIWKTKLNSPLFFGESIACKVEPIHIEKPVAINFFFGDYKDYKIAFVRPSSDKFVAFDFMAYIKPDRQLKLYQVTVKKNAWNYIYDSVNKFLIPKNLDAFQRVFSFNLHEDIILNTTFVWMVGKSEEIILNKYYEEYQKLKADGQVEKLLKDNSSKVSTNRTDTHKQYICAVFQFKNEFIYFEDMGQPHIFNSLLLREYASLKALCKADTE